MISKKTISNFLYDKKKLFNYISHESKNVFNHYLFCHKVFMEFKYVIYEKVSKKTNEINDVNEEILIEMEKHYQIYSNQLNNIKNNNNLIYKYITQDNPNVYDFNFNDLFEKYKKECNDLVGIIKNETYNNIIYDNIIKNILKSRYFYNYYKLRSELIDHKKPTNNYDKRFIDHVKSKKTIFENVNNPFKNKLKSEQNLIRRFAYKMLNDCLLPSDIIINIMNKCYYAYSSFISLKQKGIKNGKIRYLPKEGHYIIPFFTHCFKIVNNKIRLSIGKKIAEKMKTNKFVYVNLPAKLRRKNCEIKMIEICPIYEGYKYKINITYDIKLETEKKKITNKNDLISIDLGINNLMTIYNPESSPEIFRGSFLTSPNFYFNRKIDELKSKLPKNNKTSKQIRNLFIKRDNVLNYRMNIIVSKLYELYKNKKGIVIGYNSGWKQEVSLGRKTNRKFYGVPYEKLIRKIEDKFNETNVIKINEAYTSKSDSLMLEEIKKKNEYSGRRIKRGLFLSGTGKKINADLNGAINIMRLYCKKENMVFNEISGKNILNPIVQKIRIE